MELIIGKENKLDRNPDKIIYIIINIYNII